MCEMIDLLYKDISITALEFWASPKNPFMPFYKSLGFKAADPHEYAAQVHGAYYPFTLMATTMKTALEHKEQIQKLIKKFNKIKSKL